MAEMLRGTKKTVKSHNHCQNRVEHKNSFFLVILKKYENKNNGKPPSLAKRNSVFWKNMKKV